MSTCYIVVNNSLGMQKGKIVAQSGHGIISMIRILEKTKPKYYESWLKSGEKIVCVKAPIEDFDDLFSYTKETDLDKIWAISVIDAGRTQVAPDSMTVIVFRPIPDSMIPDSLKKLKLF